MLKARPMLLTALFLALFSPHAYAEDSVPGTAETPAEVTEGPAQTDPPAPGNAAPQEAPVPSREPDNTPGGLGDSAPDTAVTPQGTPALPDDPGKSSDHAETDVGKQTPQEATHPSPAASVTDSPVSPAVGTTGTSVQNEESLRKPKGSIAEPAPTTAVTPTTIDRSTLPSAATATSPTAAPASVQVSARENAFRTWQFLKENGKDTREEMVDFMLLQASEFLRQNADWDFSDEVRLLKADLNQRKGEYKSAAVDLLALIYEYPNSRSLLQAKSALADLVDKKLGKKLKPLFIEAAKGSEARDKAKRLSRLLKKLVIDGGEALYEPLVPEFNSFFARFPEYAGTDEMVLLAGDLYAQKERYLAALTCYRKLLALYPESRLRPRALRSVGDLYSRNLKDTTSAANTYQEVISQYPDSDEAGYAYEQLARIQEQLKHYDLAVEIHEKIIRLYPNSAPALRSFLSEAAIQRDQLDRPLDAIRTLERLADMFKGSTDAADALKSAATLARKQKKYDQETALYLRIVEECKGIKDAPDLLFKAAEVSEEDLGNKDKARELYRMLTEKYPGSGQAGKAQSRIDRITKK